DLWEINELQELLNNSYTRQLVPEAQSAIGWVNGNLYTQTTEVFGILPVPSDVQTSAGMTPFDPTNPPQSHLYLAKKQGTRFTVLTLHTDDEKKWFSRFMRTESAFSSPRGPDWPNATQSGIRVLMERHYSISFQNI
ncbi:hypothetical protein L208DRAFT_1512518, partial [Tricholoma matsutake]